MIDPRNTPAVNSVVNGPFTQNPEGASYSTTTEDLLDKIAGSTAAIAGNAQPINNWYPVEMFDYNNISSQNVYNKVSISGNQGNGIYKFLFDFAGQVPAQTWIDDLYSNFLNSTSVFTFSIVEEGTNTIFTFNLDINTIINVNYNPSNYFHFDYDTPINQDPTIQLDYSSNIPNMPMFNSGMNWYIAAELNVAQGKCFLRWFNFNPSVNSYDTEDDGYTPYSPIGSIDTKACVIIKLIDKLAANKACDCKPIGTGIAYCDQGSTIFLSFTLDASTGLTTGIWTDEQGAIVTPSGNQTLGACEITRCVAYENVMFSSYAAVSLSPPPNAQRAVIVFEADPTSTIKLRQARLREDGVHPTALLGFPLNDNSIYEVVGADNLYYFRIIGVETAKLHTLQIQYFNK